MKYKERFTLLTFYKFVDVENPEREVRDHLIFCKDIGMKGRIYIGTEGISATCTGNDGQIKAYKLYLQSHPLFSNPPDLDVKATEVDAHKFPKMTVKVREEIVSLGKKYSREEIEKAGNRMEISDFKKLIDEGKIEDYIILDMRNNHEYNLGHFKGAIPANTLTFKELEDKIDEYKHQFGDKKVISYCTGGIRCEKSTVMLQKAGLKNTYQLDGGVVKYINTYDDGNWLGSLYVFDDRVSYKVGSPEKHSVIGECSFSGKKTDSCENCRYSPCNARLIAIPKEYKKHFGFCSQECVEKAKKDGLIKEIDFDPINYKQERSLVKTGKQSFEQMIEKIQKNIDIHLKGILFKHQLSQKEDFIIQD